MDKQLIAVPDEVWQQFSRPLLAEFGSEDRLERSLQRVYRLTALALDGFDVRHSQWVINDGQYRSPYCLEPNGFHRVGDLFYVYGENRGTKIPIAIFKSSHLAADYFVCLVTDGKRTIDWSLFPEMDH